MRPRFRLYLAGIRAFLEYDSLEACFNAARDVTWVSAQMQSRDGSWENATTLIRHLEQINRHRDTPATLYVLTAVEEHLLSNQEKWYV